MLVTMKQIQQARANLAGVTIPTPLQDSNTFSRLSGNEIYLKTENLKKQVHSKFAELTTK